MRNRTFAERSNDSRREPNRSGFLDVRSSSSMNEDWPVVRETRNRSRPPARRPLSLQSTVLAMSRGPNTSIRFLSHEPLLGPLGALDLSGIHRVIADGESGPRARPVWAEWLRSIRDTCRPQTVAFFFKQWGSRSPKFGGYKLDGLQWLEYVSTPDLNRVGPSLAVPGALPVMRRITGFDAHFTSVSGSPSCRNIANRTTGT